MECQLEYVQNVFVPDSSAKLKCGCALFLSFGIRSDRTNLEHSCLAFFENDQIHVVSTCYRSNHIDIPLPVAQKRLQNEEFRRLKDLSQPNQSSFATA